jgi:hypothetical protein
MTVLLGHLGFPETARALFLVVPPFLACLGKSFLEQKLYLLIQRAVLILCNVGKLILEPLPDSEQQSNPVPPSEVSQQ